MTSFYYFLVWSWIPVISFESTSRKLDRVGEGHMKTCGLLQPKRWSQWPAPCWIMGKICQFEFKNQLPEGLFKSIVFKDFSVCFFNNILDNCKHVQMSVFVFLCFCYPLHVCTYSSSLIYYTLSIKVSWMLFHYNKTFNIIQSYLVYINQWRKWNSY